LNKLTRRGVAYDFNNSPFKMLISYDDDDITFVFSSQLYKDKFAARLEENRESINNSLSNRFGFNIINNKIADLRLYQNIEKRGFLIYKGLVKVQCLNDITLNGHKLTSKS
jgi:hypothetical protein